MWTQTDLDVIDAAIAQGVQECRFSDRTVIYRSIADLLKAREVIVGSIDTENGTVRTRQTRLWSESGW